MLEFESIIRAIKALMPVPMGKSITIFFDNISAVTYQQTGRDSFPVAVSQSLGLPILVQVHGHRNTSDSLCRQRQRARRCPVKRSCFARRMGFGSALGRPPLRPARQAARRPFCDRNEQEVGDLLFKKFSSASLGARRVFIPVGRNSLLRFSAIQSNPQSPQQGQDMQDTRDSHSPSVAVATVVPVSSPPLSRSPDCSSS